MNTIAIEFVPPNVEDGVERAAEEAQKVVDLSKQFGMGGRIRHLMIPGMIEEEEDRPVPMRPKFDPLETWNAAKKVASDMKGICTQVTAFLDEKQLEARFDELLKAGMEGIVFVGVPRTMADGEGSGVAPTDALRDFAGQVPNRGAILIPTREGEFGRANFKCERGVTFFLSQLLYSDAIVEFLRDFAKKTEHRPELLLSFGFVPKVEQKVKLINWLIQDPGNERVEQEQAYVAQLSEMPFKERKRSLLDLYKRVIDGVGELGFPLSIHLEAPYGFVKPAFETFAEMLEYWAPDTAANKKRQGEKIDEAVEETFPASDPPSTSSPGGGA